MKKRKQFTYDGANKTYLQTKYTVRKGKRKLRNKYLQVKIKREN